MNAPSCCSGAFLTLGRTHDLGCVTGPLVVGLDLSLTSTGVARSDGDVRTVTSQGRADADLPTRHARITGLADLICSNTLHAQLVVVESPSLGSTARQRGNHDRAGLWWAVVDRLLRHKIPVAEITPAARAKYATGKGNAPKDTVFAATLRRFTDWEFEGNDQADALVLCAMGRDHLGAPLKDMPALNREALDKVAWPVVIAA